MGSFIGGREGNGKRKGEREREEKERQRKKKRRQEKSCLGLQNISGKESRNRWDLSLKGMGYGLPCTQV